MEIKDALKGQYRAGLAMLRECIEKCPDDLWIGGTHPRNTWRIAYHAIFYTHFYLQTHMDAFIPWESHRQHIPALWDDEEEPTPIELPYSKAETLEYLSLVHAGVAGWVDALDLNSLESGFHWYKLTKIEHQLLNIRHLGGHVGQLSELVMASGADLDWVSTR